MRILTVRQPWAWAIIHGGKDVENRARNIAGGYRGPVAIHVAQADAESVPDGLWLSHANWYRARGRQPKKFDPTFWDRGYIIGVVDLVDVHTAQACLDDEGMTCSEWAEQATLEEFHLELANPRALDEPIPYRGALGLRTLDIDTKARIIAQIEGDS